ncbi:Arginyl-tRNA--protein transferase 1 [Entomortierella chlamydospora]|uniref:Arginyl-tRNA--protein transferase 1 n=1 Tax=Entomortierella chlamydospora TaxID=101097 RepID=A0A9P6MTV9_9FUNG|nr:Arginyl-tRNA--protein transferase 1 [Entomortierella chlamydospora]
MYQHVDQSLNNKPNPNSNNNNNNNNTDTNRNTKDSSIEDGDASEFQASKHQRQVVNRFNNYIQEGDENFEKDIVSRQEARKQSSNAENKSSEPETTAPSIEPTDTSALAEVPAPGKKQKPRKPPKNVAADLITRIRSSEYLLSPEITSWKHRLRIVLEPASFTEEKYKLYVKYQMEVHHEPESKCRVSGFNDFLVSSPITATKTVGWREDDPGFGSFHQNYYLDDKLIAVSVIDILPECVSAVYFFYDTDYSSLSLGKYSAQREIALAESLSAKPGYETVQYYYMGFYIFTCPKMAYKGQFHPSYLLDPETYNWIKYDKCKEIIKDQRYSAFENPSTMNPLFEAKMKSIINHKRGQPENDYDSEDYEDDIEDWESVDEEDEEDENSDDNSDKEEEEGGEGEGSEDQGKRKKKRLDTTDEERRKKAAEAAERQRKKEIEKAFVETLALPPPGCLNTKDITDEDVKSILCLVRQRVVPVTDTDMYKYQSGIKDFVKEFYSYFGKDGWDDLFIILH